MNASERAKTERKALVPSKATSTKAKSEGKLTPSVARSSNKGCCTLDNDGQELDADDIIEHIANDRVGGCVDLSGIDFSGIAGLALVEALARNTTVDTLLLTNCGIGAKIGKAIAKALQDHCVCHMTLQMLDLRGNPLGRSAIERISKVVKKRFGFLNMQVLFGSAPADECMCLSCDSDANPEETVAQVSIEQQQFVENLCLLARYWKRLRHAQSVMRMYSNSLAAAISYAIRRYCRGCASMWRRYTQHKLSLLQQTPNGAASEEAERAPPLLKNGTWGELPTRVGLKRKGSPGDRTSTADNSTVIVPSQSDQAAKAQQRAARDYEAEGLSELALALVWRKVALEVNCLMKTGEIRDSQDRNLFQSVQMLYCKQKLAATEHSVVEISESQKRITKKFNDFEMLEQKLGVCMNELDTVNKHFAQANVKLKDEIAHRVKLHNECEKLKQQQVQIGSEAAKKSKAKLASALERAAQAEAQLLASQVAAEKELKQAKANVVKAKAAADAAIAEAASSKVEQKAGQLPVGPNGSSLVAHNDASTKVPVPSCESLQD